MVTSSLGICAGSVNKLVINQLYHSVAEVLLYKNAKFKLLTSIVGQHKFRNTQMIVVMIMV